MSKLPLTITKYRNRLVAFEMISIFLVSVLVSAIRFGTNLVETMTQYPTAPKIFIYPLIWYFALHYTHAWDRSAIYISNEFFTRAMRTAGFSLLFFSTYAYLAKYPISRIWTVANVLATTIAVLLIRYLIRKSIQKKFAIQQSMNYLYIGRLTHQDEFLDEFASLYGFTPNVFRIDPPKLGEEDDWLKTYEEKLATRPITGVIIGYGEIQNASLLRRLADTSREQVIDLILVSRISPLVKRFEILDNPNLVRIRESHIVGSGAVMKRALDIVISSIALIILAPFFLIIALAIKLTSKGPVLYIAPRVGKNGQDFLFPKFRSMYDGADKNRLKILGRPDENMAERYKNDPRITPFGRFIRRWSIDELPQFFCVLIGTMSIVGPRPILREELIQIPEKFSIRFMVKPGLTGLWQITGRKEVAWQERMLRDIFYLENWSLTRDLTICATTISTILNGKGAI